MMKGNRKEKRRKRIEKEKEKREKKRENRQLTSASWRSASVSCT